MGGGGNRCTRISRDVDASKVQVWFVAALDRIQRVVRRELHHCHCPDDYDGILAASHRDVEADDIPLGDLIGSSSVAWRCETD
jgi:hypothetical protein